MKPIKNLCLPPMNLRVEQSREFLNRVLRQINNKKLTCWTVREMCKLNPRDVRDTLKKELMFNGDVKIIRGQNPGMKIMTPGIDLRFHDARSWYNHDTGKYVRNNAIADGRFSVLSLPFNYEKYVTPIDVLDKSSQYGSHENLIDETDPEKFALLWMTHQTFECIAADRLRESETLCKIVGEM